MGMMSWVFGFMGSLLYGYGLFRFLTKRAVVREEEDVLNNSSTNLGARERIIPVHVGASHYNIVISRLWILVPLCVAVSLTYLVKNLMAPYLDDRGGVGTRMCICLFVLVPHLGVSVQAWKRYRPVALILNMYFGTMATLYLTIDMAADVSGMGDDFSNDDTVIFPPTNRTTPLHEKKGITIDPKVQDFIDDHTFEYPLFAALREADYLNPSHLEDLQQAIPNIDSIANASLSVNNSLVSQGVHSEKEAISDTDHDKVPMSDIVFPLRMIDTARGENVMVPDADKVRHSSAPDSLGSSANDSYRSHNISGTPAEGNANPTDTNWSKWDVEKGLCFGQALVCLLLILLAAKRGDVEACEEVAEPMTWLLHIAGFCYFFGLFPLLELPQFRLDDNTDILRWVAFIALMHVLLVLQCCFPNGVW